SVRDRSMRRSGWAMTPRWTSEVSAAARVAGTWPGGAPTAAAKRVTISSVTVTGSPVTTTGGSSAVSGAVSVFTPATLPTAAPARWSGERCGTTKAARNVPGGPRDLSLYRWGDSIPRPHDYESCALTSLSTPAYPTTITSRTPAQCTPTGLCTP